MESPYMSECTRISEFASISSFRWNWWFVICTILACIIFRVIGVLLLSFFANRYRIKKLNWTEQLIMMYGGLRGGVAFALVLLIEESFAPHAKAFHQYRFLAVG